MADRNKEQAVIDKETQKPNRPKEAATLKK
ncbi:hypothetical protein CCACVL1_30063 [Corchorus capsularis]|uniref:Uncharacterized protein n=1 Tax=Corchorus capsularis TaxID=210143 RepID=A0A1R3FYV6_COCAP|nr:hypothetical protein CCACVL1_30063 [Corchorus capsularis]